jgi:hypothetical protein
MAPALVSFLSRTLVRMLIVCVLKGNTENEGTYSYVGVINFSHGPIFSLPNLHYV